MLLINVYLCLFPHKSLLRQWASCQLWVYLSFCWPYSSSSSIRSFVSLESEVCHALSSTAGVNEETALGFTKDSVSIIVQTNVSFALFCKRWTLVLKYFLLSMVNIIIVCLMTCGRKGKCLGSNYLYYMHWTTHIFVCSVGCLYLYSFQANTYSPMSKSCNPAHTHITQSVYQLGVGGSSAVVFQSSSFSKHSLCLSYEMSWVYSLDKCHASGAAELVWPKVCYMSIVSEVLGL